MKIGQLCYKTAGRDSANFAVVVDKIDNTFVLIDGNVRRKKCNIKHLEILDKTLDIKKNASTTEVQKAMQKIGIKILEKGKPRTKKQKPTKKALETKEKPKKEKKQTKKQKNA